MMDIILESVRALVLLVIVIFLWRAGRGRFQHTRWGWNLILLGFLLLLFGSLLDITDNFENLNRFVVIGDTETEAFLEKFVGFLGGFVLLAIGLVCWIPSVQRMQRELEGRVEERTQGIQQHKIRLESEIRERTIGLKEKQEALTSTEEKFRQMAENISEVFWMSDPAKNQMVYVSPAYEQTWGRSCQSLYEHPLSFVDAIHSEDRERVVEAFEKQPQGDYDEEYRIIRPDGAVRYIRDRAFPVENEHGQVYRVAGIAEDITETRLRDEQLTQAQKMEAVGQLTGGVAHDFNNLLAVILGNAELLGDEIGDNQLLATINRAGTRGAELTQRLLAFSRQQALAPQSIDLTELVSGLHDLLYRTLGEPIKIVRDIPEAVWPVTADPGQLENALLNLSINARDAMPDGGILEVRCENIQLHDGDMRVADEVQAGNYVQITVRDTGIGMSEDVLEHAFEPFYTTKDVGEGSGLGLSMVHGFARQSGGDAVIESVPGKGTEVRIFLPRARTNIAPDVRTQDNDLKRGQGEAILVLEDDPDVRSLAVAALDGLGYRVLEAADANAAMQVLEEETDNLDLLLSDVVLPGGVSGPDLAAKAKDLCPKLKIVFMTGYAANSHTHDGIPDIGEAVLNKPFKRVDLATVIHDALAA